MAAAACVMRLVTEFYKSEMAVFTSSESAARAQHLVGGLPTVLEGGTCGISRLLSTFLFTHGNYISPKQQLLDMVIRSLMLVAAIF